MENLINLYAFFLPLIIFSFWGIVGYATLSLLHTQRNVLQNLLIAPTIGFALILLFTFWINRFGIPVRHFAIPLAVFFLLMSIIILCWQKPKFPFKFYFPFVTLFLLALFLTGRPLLLYGFDWVSYSNDDMGNYCLGAMRFLNHGYFDLPNLNDLLEGKDFSQFYWFFYVPGLVRSGSELMLAWISGITHLNPLQIFMPLILAFHITLVSITGALVFMGKDKKMVAFIACLLICFSALTTLGTLYQLIAQVAGLCLMSACTLLLMQTFSVHKKHHSIFQGILIAITSAGFILVYPELTPFFVIAFVLYFFIYYLKQWRIHRMESYSPQDPIKPPIILKLNKSLIISLTFAIVLILLFLNTHILAYIIFLITQIISSKADKSYLFSYYLLPSGIANVWGLLPMTRHFIEPFTSIAICLGVLLTVFATIATARLMWIRHTSIAFVTFVMLLMAIILFKNNLGFGLFKLAMYIQPFILGVVAIAFFEWKVNKIAKSIFIILLFVPSLICINYYILRSKATTAGSFSEVVYASNKKINKELTQSLKTIPENVNLLTDDFNVSLLKYMVLQSSPHRFIFFSSPRIFYAIAHGYYLNKRKEKSLEHMIRNKLFYNDSAIEFFKQFSLLVKKDKFDLHTKTTSTMEFFHLSFNNSKKLFDENNIVIADSELRSVINRFHHLNTADRNFIFEKQINIKNHLIFIDSSIGRIYYSYINPFSHKYNESMRSFFNLEQDLYFHGKSVQALGRYLLFRVLNPTDTFRMELTTSNTLSADGVNKIPSASLIGNTRVAFPIIGRGSARVFSPPISAQMIDQIPYVAIDMNREGKLYPTERKGLMRLYGTKIQIDPRFIVTFSRDISLISDEEYKKLNRPQFIQTFPKDLANPHLEYSGIYEDSWISEDAFFVLTQPAFNSVFTIKGMMPKIDKNFVNSTLTLMLDGKTILQQQLQPGEFNIKTNIQTKEIGPRKIELHFSHFQKLPNGDNRPVAAKIHFIGFS